MSRVVRLSGRLRLLPLALASLVLSRTPLRGRSAGIGPGFAGFDGLRHFFTMSLHDLLYIPRASSIINALSKTLNGILLLYGSCTVCFERTEVSLILRVLNFR